MIKIIKIKRLHKNETGQIIDEYTTYQVEDHDGRAIVLSFKDWQRVLRGIKRLEKSAQTTELKSIRKSRQVQEITL